VVRATYNGAVLAESDETVIVEGNHYFRPESVDFSRLEPSSTHTTCSWKGEASYYDVVVDGERLRDACWYYPQTKEAARSVEGLLAFWRGVQVV
jgi:uncharacterized protein (DUF427 family)